MIAKPITAEDIAAFVPSMDNREELERLAGMDAHCAIANTVAASCHTFCGHAHGVPIFMGGVRSLGDYGGVWMLGNPGIAQAKKFYLRETRAQVAHMLTMFRALITTVDASYPRSLRWLAWLGFTIGHPLQRDGRTVHLVEKRR